MASKFMLIADDVLDPSSLGTKRSALVQKVGLGLSDKLHSPTKLIYVQNPKDKNLKTAEIEKIRATLNERFRKAGKKMQIIERQGNPVDEIFRIETSSPAPGLIVMGTHGREGFDRLFLGSVADEVVRNAVVPVMVIGPKVHGTPSGKAKLLVATDLTKNSRRAEAYAMKLAKALKAEVVLIHSLTETLRTADQYAAATGTVFIDQTTVDVIEQKTYDVINKKVQVFKLNGVTCSYMVDKGGTTSQDILVNECKKGYHYLIMGTHGKSTFVRAFIGSTAKAAILNCSIPVIVVRSHAK